MIEPIKLELTSDVEKVIEAGKLSIRGSTLLIEVLPDEEVKAAGGIVLQSSSKHVRGGVDEFRLKLGYVIAAGEGYIDEAGKVTPLDVKPGSIVFLPKYSLSAISVFPGMNRLTEERIAMIKEDQVLAFYPSLADYEAARSAGCGGGQ